MKALVARSIVALSVIASGSTAYAQSVSPLPILEAATVADGSNPVFGEAGGFGSSVHFLDPAASPQLWDSALQQTVANTHMGDGMLPPLEFQPKHCEWGGSTIYCAGSQVYPLPGPPYFTPITDMIRAYNTQTGTIDSVTYSNGIVKLRDASSEYAVWTRTDTGETRLLKPTGNGTLVDIPVFAGNSDGTDPHPVLDDTYVVYQTHSGGTYAINAWEIATQTVAYTHSVNVKPNPSQIDHGWVSYETSDSVTSGYIAGNWDPSNRVPVPQLQDCRTFRQMKKAREDLELVQGTECRDGESVLFAIRWNVDHSYTAYFVGKLSTGNPEYDAVQDEIVWTGADGKVYWVRADVALTDELEPNDSIWQANPMPYRHVAEGWFGDEASGGMIDGDDVDFWSVRLLAGQTYDIHFGWPYCEDGGFGIYAYDAAGNLLAVSSESQVLVNGVPQTSTCGALTGFTVPTSGTYYLKATSGLEFGRTYFGYEYTLYVDMY